ncbi:unnamed protein product, partial [Darwinula stevensoni]
TVSSGLNSLAAITLEDFLRPFCFKGISDQQAATVCKILALAYGIISFCLVFLVEKCGTGVLPAALSIFGIIGGPLLGIFTLGMFFPWANNKASLGSLVGGIAGFIFSFWIGVGSNLASTQERLSFSEKPMSVSACSPNATDAPSTLSPDQLPMWLYRLSYLWYSMVGCWSVIAIGLVVSWATGMQNTRTLNPKLVSPIFRYLREKLPGALVFRLGLDIGDDYVSRASSGIFSGWPNRYRSEDPFAAGTAGLKANPSRASMLTSLNGEATFSRDSSVYQVFDDVLKRQQHIGLRVFRGSDV